MSKSSRKGAAFLDAIDAAETEILKSTAAPVVTPVAPVIAAQPPAVVARAPVGYVGKALEQANASLDERLADAVSLAAERSATIASLEAQLSGGETALKLDPRRIRPSAYADRHPRAFEDDDFAEFIDEIKATGGNREPGIVRRIEGDDKYDYELAAGHRRHRACLTLSLPYFAFVRDLSDEELLVSMATENKGRKDLSPFERGRHYARLLADELFPSMRSLALALNEPSSVIHRVLAFGELPAEVIAGFLDPRSIRVQWVAPLREAFLRNPEGFKVEAAATRDDPSLSPSDVFKRLAGVSAKHSIVADKNRVLASVRMIHDRPAIVLYKGAPDELLEKLKQVIESYHAEHQGSEP